MGKLLSTLPLEYVSHVGAYIRFHAGMRNAFHRFSTCLLNAAGEGGRLRPHDQGNCWKLEVTLINNEGELNPDFSLSGKINMQLPEIPCTLNFNFSITNYLQYKIKIENPNLEVIYYDWYDAIQPRHAYLGIIDECERDAINVSNMLKIIHSFKIFFPPSVPKELEEFMNRPHSLF